MGLEIIVADLMSNVRFIFQQCFVTADYLFFLYEYLRYELQYFNPHLVCPIQEKTPASNIIYNPELEISIGSFSLEEVSLLARVKIILKLYRLTTWKNLKKK